MESGLFPLLRWMLPEEVLFRLGHRSTKENAQQLKTALLYGHALITKYTVAWYYMYIIMYTHALTLASGWCRGPASILPASAHNTAHQDVARVTTVL